MVPLCVTHSIKGGVYNWLAHTGEALIWGSFKSISPRMPKGVHLTYRIIIRETYRQLLKQLGFK